MAFLITGEPAISALALSLPESVVDQVEVSRARSTRSLRVAGKPPQRALRLVGWRNCEFDMRLRLVWRTDTHLIVRSTVVWSGLSSWWRTVRCHFLDAWYSVSRGSWRLSRSDRKEMGWWVDFCGQSFQPGAMCRPQNKVMVACARNGWH